MHETHFYHNNDVYAYRTSFWWNLWWFELILNDFWRLCLCKLTATFIVTAKLCLWGALFWGFAMFETHILGWRPQFYQNVRKPFCRHRGFQSELGADFLRIGKLRSRSFRCMCFRCPIRNIASRNCKTLSCTRKHPIGHRLAKNAFSIAF